MTAADAKKLTQILGEVRKLQAKLDGVEEEIGYVEGWLQRMLEDHERSRA